MAHQQPWRCGSSDGRHQAVSDPDDDKHRTQKAREIKVDMARCSDGREEGQRGASRGEPSAATMATAVGKRPMGPYQCTNGDESMSTGRRKARRSYAQGESGNDSAVAEHDTGGWRNGLR
jgi:hypothetical protein